MAKKTKPRTTKADTEARERAALRQRLADLACGADGCDITVMLDNGEVYNGEWLSRWLCAIRDVMLGGGDSDHAYLVGAPCVGNFDSLDSAVEHLYTSGVRADGSHLKKADA